MLGKITNEFAKKVAAHSVPAVLNAQPIKPLPNERLKKEKGFSPHIYYSPENKNLNFISSPEHQNENDRMSENESEISSLRIIAKQKRNFESKNEEEEDEW